MQKNLLPIVCALSCACGAEFVEPNPPKLQAIVRQYGAIERAEPVVYGIIFDFYLAVQSECEVAKAHWRERLRETLLPIGREGLELGVFHLSGQCAPTLNRRLPAGALDAAVAEAEAAFHGRIVRPVFIYLNNLDARLPEGLRADLKQVRTQAEARGAPVPQLWAVSTAASRSMVTFDRSVEMTYVMDPDLLRQVSELVARDLPYMSRTNVQLEPVPVLTAEELLNTQAIKLCRQDLRIHAVEFRPDGVASAVHADRPPRVRLEVQTIEAAPKSDFVKESVAIPFELCTESCDRFIKLPSRELVKWSELRGCLPAAPGQKGGS